MVHKNKIYLISLVLTLLVSACAPTPVVQENVETTDLRGIKTIGIVS